MSMDAADLEACVRVVGMKHGHAAIFRQWQRAALLGPSSSPQTPRLSYSWSRESLGSSISSDPHSPRGSVSSRMSSESLHHPNNRVARIHASHASRLRRLSSGGSPSVQPPIVATRGVAFPGMPRSPGAVSSGRPQTPSSAAGAAAGTASPGKPTTPGSMPRRLFDKPLDALFDDAMVGAPLLGAPFKTPVAFDVSVGEDAATPTSRGSDAAWMTRSSSCTPQGGGTPRGGPWY